MTDYLNKVTCGDCLDLMKELPDASIDAVITDIPYGISQTSGGLRNLHYGQWDLSAEFSEHISEMARVSAGTVVIFCDGRQLSGVLLLLEKSGYKVRHFAWHKPNPSPMNGKSILLSSVELAAWGKKPGAYFGGHCTHNYWEGTAPSGSSRVHPTQKPVPLFKSLITTSCPDEGIVLDPFAGSGTTGVACAQTGRQFIGFELNPEYCDIANKRIKDAQHTLL